jgi:hypothetical protein
MVHWRALKNMEKHWGPLESGSEVEQHHRRCMPGYEAIVAHGKTMLAREASARAPSKSSPGIEYHHHPSLPQLRRTIAKLPKGFKDIATKGLISVEVINLLELMSTSLGYTPDGQPPSEPPTTEPKSRQPSDIVTYTALAANRLSNLPLRPLEQHIAFALVAYNWTVCWSQPLSATYQPVVRDVVKVIAFQGAIKAEEAELHCIIWSLFAIAGAGYQCERPCSDTDAVLDLVVELESAREWEALECVLKAFFWAEELGVRWKQYWEDAMARRKRESTESGDVCEQKTSVPA